MSGRWEIRRKKAKRVRRYKSGGTSRYTVEVILYAVNGTEKNPAWYTVVIERRGTAVDQISGITHKPTAKRQLNKSYRQATDGKYDEG